MGVAPADTLNYAERPHTKLSLVAERPQMSDAERAAGLKALAERVVDPNWLNRDLLENIEQLTEREHQ